MSAASPKDGPSAGISICVSLLSLILNIPVPANLAMTGELSLNGEVCKIGMSYIIMHIFQYLQCYKYDFLI
jgi:Lon-like ATP-dependent protease